ncbi:TKL protein kinase [Saprolegnia parasitica CBS 223.65]|uniref:TKL protein kinase n=1 Tax=Saprolegnia parasitica (strain CBS 223.65) TaxID=695850 RepID=A0A067BNX6_SAPPC|nr:TKL protein kinase [Saprolegnia parasitica CBS 223.65]KDO19953.1 TKL protein kinase [Saprolegnia parasitica CBS 223.65]|eukprot:XP_012209324.1 TKL protein kinase [Saprolegnia parasitica CBS 223.65]
MTLGPQLLHAAFYGRIDDVQHLLKEGADVHWTNENGVTPIYAAAERGHDIVVKTLLGANAAVDRAKIDGATPLFVAAQNGHDIVVKTLLGANAAVDQAMNDGVTPLYIAAFNGHGIVVKTLLDANAAVDQARNDGATPLYIAAEKEHEVVVKTLLGANAAVDQAKNDGATPLFIAAQNGHDIVVKTLLGANASVDQAMNTGVTPLYIAAFNGHDIVVKTLVGASAAVDQAWNDGRTPLTIACEYGHKSVVKVLLKAKARVNQAMNDGDTPLMMATLPGHLDIVQRLLDAGANVNQSLQAGATPLLLAAQFGHDDATRALLRHHPNLQATDADGNTALSMATQRGHATIVRLLEEYISTNPGPQPTPPAQGSVNEKKKMELVQAVVAGHVAATKALLDQGVDARVTNEFGDGLLHLAVRHGHTQLLQMLLGCSDASLVACNKDGETPLVLAIKLRHRRFPHQIYSSSHQIADDVPATAIYIDANSLLGDGAKINVMQTYDASSSLKAVSGQYSDNPKLVLEYIDGGNLRQYLDKKRKGEATEVEYSTLDIAWVIANALADLHRNGFMHRDLKSRNVLLSSTNYIKVADFGLTREIDPNMTVGAGTCAWTAPEVFGESGSYNYAADIYSFGVILTELETLQVPYAGMTRNDITAGVCSGRLRPSVSSNCAPWFKALVDDCLSFDPTKRPTAIAIIDRLLLQEKALVGREPVAEPEWYERSSGSHHLMVVH